MVEVKLGLRTADLPYTVRFPDVSEKLFNELVDEDTKAELIDGVMVVHSPASPRHNKIAGFLRALMGCYAEQTGQGDVFGPDDLIHLATCRKFAPDAFFLETDDVPSPLPEEEFEGAPPLVMEVLSPSNRRDDLNDKRPAYREAGVKEIWFIDPQRQEVIVDRKAKRGYTTAVLTEGRAESFVLRGFWFEIAWLWADPLPKVLTCLRKLMRAR